jgi:hypothetical protein
LWISLDQTIAYRAEFAKIGAMKHCHAIALALVGWYLIIPPILHKQKTKGSSTDGLLWLDMSDGGQGAVADSAPLSQWSINSTYDSGRACEQAKLALTGRDKAMPPSDKGAILLRWAHDDSVCIAADDQRLKKK